MQRLPLYCNDLIGEHIKALSEYEARAWESLKERLRKEYLRQDIKQRYYSRAYLSQYKQSASKEDLRTYCIQFRAISSRLIKKHELDEYTVYLWFLEELPEKHQAKIVRQAGIKTSVPSTFKLNEALDAVERIYEEEESLSMLREYISSTEDIQDMIDQQREETAVIKKTVSTILLRS